jgi:hypothetical protein
VTRHFEEQAPIDHTTGRQWAKADQIPEELQVIAAALDAIYLPLLAVAEAAVVGPGVFLLPDSSVVARSGAVNCLNVHPRGA